MISRFSNIVLEWPEASLKKDFHNEYKWATGL
jgi:hypothetical protein